jgi:hypothetical protein
MRFVLPLALALAGLIATTSPAAAQVPVRLPSVLIRPVPLIRPLPLADLQITSLSEVGTTAWIVIKNQGGRAAGPEVVRLRVFDRGRLIGTFQVVAPPIPAGSSRAVTIRTPIRLTRPGLVLAARADVTNAVAERREGNNTFVRVNPPFGLSPTLLPVLSRPRVFSMRF